MKQITLAQVYKILTDCSAVIWGDYFVCYPSLDGVTGDKDNEWLFLRSDDDDGQTFSATFIEENNQNVAVEGTSMFLTNNEGDEVQLTVLVPAKLED